MTRSPTIARREIGSYFYSPIAYVALTLFLLATGFFFQTDFEPGQPAGMRNVFDWMVWLMVFIVPVLSMGLLAQEWATGTVETLFTAPVGETDVVVGKFLGAFGFFGLLLSPTLFYVLLLWLNTGGQSGARVDLGPIFAGYLGLLLVGAMFVAIGLFCSSLTRSQVVAAVSAVAILALITIAPYALQKEASKLSEFWRKASEQGVYDRYIDFSRGIVDTSHVVFFVVVTAVFLFLTVKVLEARRWK
jgi:ABC-2 type transport system permease protein